MERIVKFDGNIEEVNNKTLVVTPVLKDDILNKNLNIVEQGLKSLKNIKIEGKNKLVLIFDGYNDDAREIYEIDEIRDYVYKMFELHPEIFYYLNTSENVNRTIFMCLCNVEIHSNSDKPLKIKDMITGEKDDIVKITRVEIPKYIEKKLKRELKVFGRKIGETKENIDKIIQNYLEIEFIKSIMPTYSKEEILKEYQETITALSLDVWNGFVDLYKERFSYELFDFNDIEGEIIENIDKIYDKYKKYNKFCIQRILMSTQIKYVFFLYEDIIPLCECGSDRLFIVKLDLVKYKKNRDGLIFYPYIDRYIENDISPVGEDTIENCQIVINKNIDKIYCPKCKKWH